MTPLQVYRWRRALERGAGVSQQRAADLLGVNVRTYRRMETEGCKARRTLLAMAALRHGLNVKDTGR